MTWFNRWRKIGYRKLWYLHFGGYHEGDKGCKREYDFMLEISGHWRHAYETERELRVEAEQMLTDAGIEPPATKRQRLVMARFKKKDSTFEQ